MRDGIRLPRLRGKEGDMKRHESLRATIATTAACAGFALAAFVGPPVPAHAAYFGYMDIPADH